MSFGSAAGSCVLAMCFYRRNRVRDSSENPDMSRREVGSELQRIARPDAIMKKGFLYWNISPHFLSFHSELIMFVLVFDCC
jgi:hypothetical protein